MRLKRFKSCAAFALIEVMVATVVLAVVVIGVSGYRYYAAMDARKAAMEATASRIALLLCEGWRGVNGDETHDPAEQLGAYLTIAKDKGTKYPVLSDFNLLGRYKLILNETTYVASLWWKDVQPGLRALHVGIAWTAPRQGQSSADGTNELFGVTTYTAY